MRDVLYCALPRNIRRGSATVGPTDKDPKDINGDHSGQSERLMREMDALIKRSQLLLNGPEARPTLGSVLYANSSQPLVSEREWLTLVREIASGDQHALEALYERLSAPVSTLIQSMIGGEQTADQLTIAVFHDVWRLARAYDALVDGTVVAWVMGLARAKGLLARFAGEAGGVFSIDTRSKSGWREPAWENVAPGISVKLLATDEERHMVSMLVRLAPGGEYPAHIHSGVEELHLLEGELWIDGRKLYPGDYNRCEPGTGDKRVWSETGCMCVLVTSTRDVLL